jgi:hypothetical protein
MKKSRVQTNVLHLFMAVFFFLLLIYFPNLKNLEDYFIYFATAIFSLHFWYGAVFLIRILGPTKEIIEFPIDLSILSLKIASIYTIVIMPLWFLVNGTLMSLGVLRYHIALGRKHTKRKKEYILKKRSIEFLAVLAFFILAVLTWKLDFALFKQTVSIIVLVIQFPFLYWIFSKEKIYHGFF